MRTCKLAHWIKLWNNQSAIFLPAFGRSIEILHNDDSYSQVEGQPSMNIQWISEVYQHNQPRPCNISLRPVRTTMQTEGPAAHALRSCWDINPSKFVYLFNPLYSAFSASKHVAIALDRNPVLGYDTLHRQFHTLPGLLDSQAALSNSYRNAYVQCREAVCTIFMMVFGMTQPAHEPATLPHERQTR